MLQGMADASPPKWHLGHTTWFFDTFVLQPHAAGHRACDPLWSYQFNSYYDAVGAAIPGRSEACSAARPSPRCWPGANGWMPPEGVEALVQLGLQHEHPAPGTAADGPPGWLPTASRWNPSTTLKLS